MKRFYILNFTNTIVKEVLNLKQPQVIKLQARYRGKEENV